MLRSFSSRFHCHSTRETYTQPIEAMTLRKRHLRCCLLFICKYSVQPISGFQTLLKSNAYGRGPRIRNYYKLKNEIYRQSTVTLHALPDIHLPDLTSLNEVSRQLTEALDIGADFLQDSEDGMATMTIPEAETSAVLESMGQDLLIFLTSSVVVTLISNSIGITPILGYLVAGALLGPHGLDVFSNAKADVELGDFGILFLLFSEGLEVSSARLEKLTNYLPLGFAQISLTTGVITAAILAGAPQFLDRFLPLDEGYINIQNPTEAVVLALAGTLSTSAFIFPVLKERGWESDSSGQAATSILLLQDLFVAPLLVILPYVVGQGPTDFAEIGFLTVKAVVGFGLVIYLGSFLLQRLFNLVAQTKSTETFVALSLLVSVGMGALAQICGLTDTAGAFAAGVLLANTGLRAQIQADVLPFKGILLGIFFMDAGSLFDSSLVLSELPTVLTGAVALIVLKTFTIAAATRVPRWMEPNRLVPSEAAKLSLILSGGGEFAFVVLAIAERLEVLPKDLGGLLTSIVLITMAVTPLLGGVAEWAADLFDPDNSIKTSFEPNGQTIAEDAIVVCGYSSIGEEMLCQLHSDLDFQEELSQPQIIAIDNEPFLINQMLTPRENTAVLFGDGENPEVLKNHGVVKPRAILISYDDEEQVLAATTRLRMLFVDTPIFAVSCSQNKEELKAAGATEVMEEHDELVRYASSFLSNQMAQQEH